MNTLFRRFKLEWTTLTNTAHYSDPVASSYGKYSHIAQNTGEQKDEVDLVNAAMKLNSSLSGGGNSDNLAHKFYYHIPHPSVTYINSDLKKYGEDNYAQPQTQQYPDQSQNYVYGAQGYAQGAYPAMDPALSYNYGYYGNYGQTYQYYGQGGYDYSQYYAQGYYQPSTDANGANTTYGKNLGEFMIDSDAILAPPTTPADTEGHISVKFYEDVNKEEVYVETLSEEEIKQENQQTVSEVLNDDLILF